MADAITQRYHAVEPLKVGRLRGLAYAGVMMLIWLPVLLFITQWLFP